MYPNQDAIFERLETTKKFGLVSDYLVSWIGTLRPARSQGDGLGQGRHAGRRRPALHRPAAQGPGQRPPHHRRRLDLAASYGPSGSASAARRSAAARAKPSIMLLRVAACRRCSGASHTISRAEGVGDDQAGVGRENLARHFERGGEEQPVAVQPVVDPFLVGAEIGDRRLDLDDPDFAAARRAPPGRRAGRTPAAIRSPPRTRANAGAAWCRARPRARSPIGGRRRAATRRAS